MASSPTLEASSRAWAIVTGASSGLGRAFALALAARGYPLLVVARRRNRLEELAAEVRGRGGTIDVLVADLAATPGIEAVLARAADRDVEMLVNNAGVASYGAFTELEPDRERELVRLNVEAIVSLTRGLLPAMLARGHGGVINVASQMAFQPMPYFAAYAASKAFVLSFSEALAEELRGSDVRVTVVAPGFTTTEFTQTAGSAHAERLFPHLDAARVAESGLRAHERGRTVKVVGGLYSFLSLSGRFAPRFVLRRAMKRVLRPPAHPASVSASPAADGPAKEERSAE
jgi:short-subunit dehydrogenase